MLLLNIEPRTVGQEHERTDASERSALERACLLNHRAAEPLTPCVVIVGSGDGVRMLELMARMGGAGEVHTVTDAGLAADHFLELRPDLVVIDYDTSNVAGQDILASLRRVLPDEEFLPVMALAGDHFTRAPHHERDSDAVDLVTKPYNPVEFVGRVTNLLRMRGLYRTLKGHNIDKRAAAAHAGTRTTPGARSPYPKR